MASGLPGQAQRFFGSGGRDMACEAAEQVEDALAPGAQRILRAEDLPRAHAARPREDREQDVVGIAGLVAANVRLALEGGLQRLKRAAQALQRLVALRACLL